MKALPPVKFIDVCDVEVVDEDSFLAGSMTIKAKNTILKERIWINCVASELCFCLCIRTLALLLHDERVLASVSTSEISLMECSHFGTSC